MGGIVLGLVLAWLTSHWLSQTFNDAPAEITLTLLYEMAYAEARAAREVLQELKVLELDPALKAQCQEVYQGYLLHGKQQQEEIRTYARNCRVD